MNVLDLFSGIGGFSLGLERAGMKTVAFCEIESFPRKVLEKHWPNVPIYNDVRTLTAERLAADGIAVDVICGGFPCQDISFAGAGAGLAGERSGLWREYARLIGELRPSYVIVENVAALLGRGLGDVLADLAEIGYDAEWRCIRAADCGAEHERDRLWVIAYPNGSRKLQSQRIKQNERGWIGDRIAPTVTHFNKTRHEIGLQTRENAPYVEKITTRLRPAFVSENPLPRNYWSHKPVLGRGFHGVSDRVDRIAALGNAVVPQIPELIGRAIMEARLT